MAGRVEISRGRVEAVLNSPGGVVTRWVEKVIQEIHAEAVATAPENDPLNAQHRGGITGTYKRGLVVDGAHRAGRIVWGRVEATAGHSDIVEFGRPQVGAPYPQPGGVYQAFSWTKWGGNIRSTMVTSARLGRHTLGAAFALTVDHLDI